MMRQMGGKGEAIDKLEAAAAKGDAPEAELIELYMLARREQAKALVDPSTGDHLAQALRMIACESQEHHDAGRLPDEAHERAMDAIAEDLSMSRADFEKDLDAKSDENTEQMLTLLRDEGFAAKVQARFAKLVPVVEAQVKKVKEGGESEGAGNAAMAEAMLTQMKSWQEARVCLSVSSRSARSRVTYRARLPCLAGRGASREDAHGAAGTARQGQGASV